MTEFFQKNALPINARILRIAFWAVVSMALFSFIHGAFLTDVWPNEDGLFSFSSTSLSLYVTFGRWGLALYRYIFGATMSPWTCSLMAGLYLTAAVLIQISLFRLNSPIAKLTYIVITFASLQFAEMMEWRMQSDAVGLGILLATLSIRFLVRNSTGKGIAIAIALLVPAIAIYQTIAWHYAILLLLLLFNEKIRGDKRPYLSFITKGLLVAVLAAALSVLVGKTLARLHPAPEEVALFASAYQHGFNIWEVSREHWFDSSMFMLFFACDIREILLESVGCHSWNSLHNAAYVTTLSLIPTLAIVVKILRSEQSPKQKSMLGFLLALIFFFPYTPIFIMSCRVCRCFFADPPAHALIWALFAAGLSREIFKKGLIVLLLFVAIKSSYAVSCSEERRKAHCMRVILDRHSAEVAATLCSKREPDSSESRNILIVTGKKHQANLDTISPFPLYKNLRRATGKEEKNYAEAIETMGRWPQKTSIRAIDDKILIRM